MDEKELLDAQKELWNSPSVGMTSSEIDSAYRKFNNTVYGPVRLRAALVLSAVLVIVLGFFSINAILKDRVTPLVPEIRYVEACIGHEGVREMRLSDSTVVFLNAETRLVYPEQMTGSSREVFLSGEAFFEVARDTLHPFIVHAGGNDIKVTGTKFNVRSYIDDDVTTTTLIEGAVEVLIEGQANAITLTPGMSLSVDNRTSGVALYKIDNGAFPAWHKGEYNAYHLSLSEIAHDLERRFGVKIMIADDRIANRIFYASFVNNESAEDILKALNVNNIFKIRKDNSFFYIY